MIFAVARVYGKLGKLWELRSGLTTVQAGGVLRAYNTRTTEMVWFQK